MKERKKIISLGFDFPGDNVEYITFFSDRSLTDADIVVCKPDYKIINLIINQAKKRNSPINGFHEDCKDHWVKEFNEISSESKNKTIIFYLDAPMHISTINESSYYFIPFIHSPSIASGNRIILDNRSDLIKEYWEFFKEHSKYTAYFEKSSCPLHCHPLLFANSPNRIVGGFYKERDSTIVFLPPLEEYLFKYIDRESKVWSTESIELGKSLAKCFENIDYYIQSVNSKTKPPDWICDPAFTLFGFTEINNKIDDTKRQIEKLNNDIREFERLKITEEKLHYLLYETGENLENAVREALIILEFNIEISKNENNNFDVKFSSKEGSFLGEIEGKDNRAITIDKFRQLLDEIEDDQENNENEEYSIGVLFGNAFRLTKPSERSEHFTESCIKKAEKHRFILVRTTDLFHVTRYVKEHDDKAFAKLCREAFNNSRGKVINFPPIP